MDNMNMVEMSRDVILDEFVHALVAIVMNPAKTKHLFAKEVIERANKIMDDFRDMEENQLPPDKDVRFIIAVYKLMEEVYSE